LSSHNTSAQYVGPMHWIMC